MARAGRRNGKSSKGSVLGFIGGVGAHVGCSNDDTSFFCTLTKITSVISQVIFLGIIGYLFYFFIIKRYLLK